MAASPSSSPMRLLHAALAVLPSLIFLVALYPAVTDAQFIDCYRFDGTITPNNTRCPGSNTCCGHDSTCLSNRLCTPANDPKPNARLVRGPCAVKEWDDSCPQICRYKEGRLFPRVSTCSDGSLCCDDDPKCCERGKGIFLDESGNQVDSRATGVTTSYPPTAGGASRYTLGVTPYPSVQETSAIITSSGTRSTGASSKSSSTPATTATDADSDSSPHTTSSAGAPSTSTPSTSSTGGNSTGLQIGLGVGVPVGVLAVAGLVYWFLRRRIQAVTASLQAGAEKRGGGGHYQPMETTPGAASYPASRVPSYPPSAVASYPSGVAATGSPGSEQSMVQPTVNQYQYQAVEIGGQMATELQAPSSGMDQKSMHYHPPSQPGPQWTGQRYEMS